jgi:miniconductance mechanosensitive channel
MRDYIKTIIDRWLLNEGIPEQGVIGMADGLSIAVEVLILILIGLAIQKLSSFIIEKLCKRVKNTTLKIFLSHRVLRKALLLIVPVMLYIFSSSFQPPLVLLTRLTTCVVIIILCIDINAVFRALLEIYEAREVSKIRPIKGYLQIIQVIGAIFAGLLFFAVLAGKDPWMLMSGFGALSAVLLLVFRDPLLGLVAGIQITANDMIRIDDWIELPNYRSPGSREAAGGNSKNIIAGFVTDINLITVKIQTFDKTIVSIPAYTLVSDVFRNWRGIMRKGFRHIQRVLPIDTSTVKPCSPALLETLAELPELRVFFETQNESVPPPDNLTLFRVYALETLKQHPTLTKDLRLSVRVLDLAAGRGIPLEIHAFTSHHEFHAFAQLEFELIAHLIAMVSRFELRLFQEPSGNDLRSLV